MKKKNFSHCKKKDSSPSTMDDAIKAHFASFLQEMQKHQETSDNARAQSMADAVRAETQILVGELHAGNQTLADAVRAENQALMGAVRAETQTLAGAVRAETQTLVGELRAEAQTLVGELRAENQALAGVVRAETQALVGELHVENQALAEEMRVVRAENQALVEEVREIRLQTEEHKTLLVQTVGVFQNIVQQWHEQQQVTNQALLLAAKDHDAMQSVALGGAIEGKIDTLVGINKDVLQMFQSKVEDCMYNLSSFDAEVNEMTSSVLVETGFPFEGSYK